MLHKKKQKTKQNKLNQSRLEMSNLNKKIKSPQNKYSLVKQLSQTTGIVFIQEAKKTLNTFITLCQKSKKSLKTKKPKIK